MSDILKDPEIMRQIIMDHYQYPHHHHLKEGDDVLSKHMSSASCIDDITVQLVLADDVISEVRFDGVGCAISTASTSIMTELLTGKTVDQAKDIIAQFFAMVDERDYDEEKLEEAVVFCNVSKQAARIKCATIGWQAVTEMLEEADEKGK
ncbi:MAG: SUF system NifU family Fe-S cluster assembly protein [Erysipelotrichaceae bacterium]|jgi:nitrogen fixation NifU-like protein|nr:SUF system NifU family Fe-S cluster assembly protein [Erysipelotrichaceae bacterium]